MLKQYERGVVFLLGRFAGVRGPGLTLIFVPIQQMTRVSLRTVTMQIPSQKIITKDNVSIDIAAVAYYHITDPEKAVIAIENVYNAINQISQTTVRNVVGRFSLDQLLSDTASINDQIKNVIDQHTEPWGTQVTAVEIKDITLPDNMQRAMAKEAEAERERRAKIVAAEGEYQAAVKLGQAADIITQHPVALQLRTLQTMANLGGEEFHHHLPRPVHDDGAGSRSRCFQRTRRRNSPIYDRPGARWPGRSGGFPANGTSRRPASATTASSVQASLVEIANAAFSTIGRTWASTVASDTPGGRCRNSFRSSPIASAAVTSQQGRSAVLGRSRDESLQPRGKMDRRLLHRVMPAIADLLDFRVGIERGIDTANHILADAVVEFADTARASAP